MKYLIAILAAAVAAPAFAQDGAVFDNPTPVDFTRPFINDRVRPAEKADIEAIAKTLAADGYGVPTIRVENYGTARRIVYLSKTPEPPAPVKAEPDKKEETAQWLALLAVAAIAVAGPAFAQDGATFRNPSPVDFNKPFLFDGVNVRNADDSGIPTVVIDNRIAPPTGRIDPPPPTDFTKPYQFDRAPDRIRGLFSASFTLAPDGSLTDPAPINARIDVVATKDAEAAGTPSR